LARAPGDVTAGRSARGSAASRFTEYVALGDSLSIDLYPALDAGEVDVAVALERDPEAGAVAPLGAAALFHRNQETHWPEFAGRDLATLYPGIGYRSLAEDGATIGDVYAQLATLGESDAPTLITLTVGGNDLLSAMANRPKERLLATIVRDIAEAYSYVVSAVREARPSACIILTTVYDPSDRLARIPGVLEDVGPLPLHHLDALNKRIRDLARGDPDLRLADVYLHFLGHGASVPESDRWYWRRSLIEPNARGASEIRRVWWEALN
jgi:lysophospholipase L1-like esterase